VLRLLQSGDVAASEALMTAHIGHTRGPVGRALRRRGPPGPGPVTRGRPARPVTGTGTRPARAGNPPGRDRRGR
jgi:hypothetical protein